MSHHIPFKHFHDLTEDDINVEYQTHTTQTDGHASIREVLQRAHERQLRAIAFTEHVRRSTDWFADFARDVRAEAAQFPNLTVYVGCEAKALNTNGGLDVSDEVRAQCEIVLGSVHTFPKQYGKFDDYDKTNPQDARRFAEIECELALGLLKYAPIDVLAHPGGMYQKRFGKFPDDLFREMMLATRVQNVAIEISSSYLYDFPAFLRLCDEINPIVSIGSDVHELDHVARCRDTLRQLRITNYELRMRTNTAAF